MLDYSYWYGIKVEINSNRYLYLYCFLVEGVHIESVTRHVSQQMNQCDQSVGHAKAKALNP